MNSQNNDSNSANTQRQPRRRQPQPQHEQDPREAFIQALLPDLPLLQYGSGDVHPTQVDAGTTELIATLTADYVDKLVKAAMDAHDVLTDGAGGCLPKKSFVRKKEDDWGESLPIPKIIDRSNGGGSGSGGGANAASVSAEEYGHDDGDGNDDDDDDDDEDDHVYLQGVDIYPDRIRAAHTKHAIGTQSFIFPICHDAEIYNKVKSNERFKADIDNVLMDTAMMDFIREEEEGYDHLAHAVFDWVRPPPTAAALAGVGDASAAAADGGEEGKVLKERSAARKKEMARRLAVRTGLDVQIPGLKDMLLPFHSTNDHSLGSPAVVTAPAKSQEGKKAS